MQKKKKKKRAKYKHLELKLFQKIYGYMTKIIVDITGTLGAGGIKQSTQGVKRLLQIKNEKRDQRKMNSIFKRFTLKSEIERGLKWLWC